MKRFLKPWRHDEKGFTLIELLVVIALLGLLAGIAIPNVIGFIGRGDEEAKDTDEHNIQTAVLALFADAGKHELDNPSGYDEVDTLAEVHDITATSDTIPSVTYYLDDYLVVGRYPLVQAYDIDRYGLVTVD